MARERPFKDEVKAFRKALPVSSKSEDREHLQRWEVDTRAQEIWDKFGALSPATSPKEFIARGLAVRRYAEALPTQISDSKDWHKEWRNYFARCATDIFDPRRSLSDARGMLGILYREADSALYLHRSRLPLKPHVSRQNKTRKREDKTQKDNNWRAHRTCIVLLSDFWHEQCGHWGDVAVAALTDIAFDTEIAAHQVRSVRRQRKATTGELGL